MVAKKNNIKTAAKNSVVFKFAQKARIDVNNKVLCDVALFPGLLWFLLSSCFLPLASCLLLLSIAAIIANTVAVANAAAAANTAAAVVVVSRLSCFSSFILLFFWCALLSYCCAAFLPVDNEDSRGAILAVVLVYLLTSPFAQLHTHTYTCRCWTKTS